MVDRSLWSQRMLGALFPAVPVPLRRDGSYDEAAQERYVQYMSHQQVTGVAVWAHTGRGLNIGKELREKVLRSWRNGLSPGATIIAGVGGKTDEEAVRMAEEAKTWGADALMAYAPVAYRGLPDQDARVVERHRRLAEVGLPLILFYLYEDAGGISYSMSVLEQLFSIPNVVGIKMATLNNVMVYQDVAKLIRSSAPDVLLITGEDRFLGYSLMCGAQAALIGMGAACPRFQHDLVKAWVGGDAHRFLQLSTKVDLFAQCTFIAPMEGYIQRMLHCLVELGVIPAESAHDPWGPALAEGDLDEVSRVLRNIGEV